VLEALWTEGPLSPNAAHALVGEPRSISVNTVSSALKRLYEKGLLRREKVSHAYVYEAAVTRAELQRHLISAIAEQFDDQGGLGLLAAFVDLAQEQGEASLRRLERLVAAKLTQGEP
jgi:predicted transcriptional regulator